MGLLTGTPAPCIKPFLGTTEAELTAEALDELSNNKGED